MLKPKPTIKYLLILLGFSLAALGGCAAEEEPEEEEPEEEIPAPGG